MEHEHSYFQTFRETCRVLTSTLDIGEVIQPIARLTAEAARVKGCTIRLLNEKERRLNLIASHGLSERYLHKSPIDVDRSLTESLKGVPVRIRDVTTDARVQCPSEAQAEGIASMLSVPMFLKGNVIGVLRLYSESPRDFPEEEVEFASALAELGAIALENARLYSSLRDQHENLMGDFTTWFETGAATPRRISPNQEEKNL